MNETIIERQRDDHSHMDQQIEEYRQSSLERRTALFRDLVTLVTTHAFAEESVLFPAARSALGDRGDALTTAIEGEHQEVNDLLSEMDGLRPGDPAFDASAERLFSILRHDARQEEDVLLASMAEVLDTSQLAAIGADWAAVKHVAPNRAHPAVPRRPPGNLLAALPLTLLDQGRSLRARLRHSPQ